MAARGPHQLLPWGHTFQVFWSTDSNSICPFSCPPNQVMDLIELTPIADAMVGLPGSGLSVEQRKRLTIAVELVANPSIVFMDEPTSGEGRRAWQAGRRDLGACWGMCVVHPAPHRCKPLRSPIPPCLTLLPAGITFHPCRPGRPRRRPGHARRQGHRQHRAHGCAGRARFWRGLPRLRWLLRCPALSLPGHPAHLSNRRR